MELEAQADKTSLLVSKDEFPENSKLTLTWCDLSVWIKKRKKDSASLWHGSHWEGQKILNNVSGVCKSGSLMAIMGSSGGGKTTLLATLSQRMKVGEIHGDILINGRSVSPDLMNKISGFVPQHDLVVESLNVLEHMTFMASLRMDRRNNSKTRQHTIDALLNELGLNKCKYSRLSTLSGGERKRVSLAVQLLTDPPLLFCDEPTTGLDSYNANSVVETLRVFAERGKTVICTIHQPASSIFDMFSRVLLLAGGRVAYQGDAAGATNHFNSLGYVCPVTYNKVEFYIAQIAVIPGKEEESGHNIDRLCDAFDSSQYGTSLIQQLMVHRGRPSSDLHSENIAFFPEYVSIQKARCPTQLYWLVWRSFIDLYRNSKHHILKFAMLLLIALLISVPYTDMVVDQRGIQNLQGLMYLVIAEIVFTYSYSVLHTFSHEMPISLREIGGDLYRPGAYYVSKMLVIVPQAVIEPFVYCSLVFYIAGLSGGAMGLIGFSLPVIMCAFSATAYGYGVSALFESVPMATLLSVPFDFVFVVFSGIFLQLDTLPPFLSWIRYLSQFFYGIEAISVHQWTSVKTIDCFPDPTLPCISSGAGVLKKYGYNADHFQIDILGLTCIYCVSHFLGFLAICRRSKKQPVY